MEEKAGGRIVGKGKGKADNEARGKCEWREETNWPRKDDRQGLMRNDSNVEEAKPFT